MVVMVPEHPNVRGAAIAGIGAHINTAAANRLFIHFPPQNGFATAP